MTSPNHELTRLTIQKPPDDVYHQARLVTHPQRTCLRLISRFPGQEWGSTYEPTMMQKAKSTNLPAIDVKLYGVAELPPLDLQPSTTSSIHNRQHCLCSLFVAHCLLAFHWRRTGIVYHLGCRSKYTDKIPCFKRTASNKPVRLHSIILSYDSSSHSQWLRYPWSADIRTEWSSKHLYCLSLFNNWSYGEYKRCDLSWSKPLRQQDHMFVGHRKLQG